MLMRRISLLLILAILLCGCHPSVREADTYTPPTTINAETNDASVYHWAQPSIFADMPPLVLESVSNERFYHDHSTLAADEAAIACFQRTAVIDGKEVTIGTFRVSEDGKLVKLCTDTICRSEIDLPCEHLVIAGRAAIWCDESFYLIGATLSPESGNAERFFILRLRDGSAEFDKIFETSRVLNDLQISGGLLYAVSKPEFAGDTHVYYAIDPDMRVYTEIMTGDESYHFGRDRILMTDDTGTYLTDSILRRAGKCCEATQLDRGILAENGYWYLHDGTLWRAEATVRGQVTRMLDDVWQFSVCGDTIFYQVKPNEPTEILFYYQDYLVENGNSLPLGTVPYIGYRHAAIRCADLTAGSRLANDRMLFSPGENEWLFLFARHTQLGDYFSFTTISPGNEADIRYYHTDYITDGQQILTASSRIS